MRKTITLNKKTIIHPSNFKNNPKKTINSRSPLIHSEFVEIEKIWKDETVYIIGGGPSLINFDWNNLKGKRVIAVNRAFQVLPDADVLYWTDSRFYKWYKSEIDMFNGVKYTCRTSNLYNNNVRIVYPSSKVFDLRSKFISNANNSGYAAINLAYKLGAKKVYLLGYDMNIPGNKTHWHDGYDVKHNKNVYSNMMKHFISLSNEIKNIDFEIINANPLSRMNCFPKCTLKEALDN